MLPKKLPVMTVLIVTAAVLIPMRAFLLMATGFHTAWLGLLAMDVWLPLACSALLLYSPFVQRSMKLAPHKARQ